MESEELQEIKKYFDRKFDDLKQEVDDLKQEVNQKVDAIDKKVDQKFDAIDKKVDDLKQRLDTLEDYAQFSVEAHSVNIVAENFKKKRVPDLTY